MNNRGQFETKLLIIVMIFIIGIILFFFSHVNKQLYDSLDEYFEDSEYANTTAHETLEDIQTLEGSNIWDWVFLAIYIGLVLQMIMFSFATRINVAFYWIYALLGMIILVVGTVLSNTWQAMVVNPEFAVTITRFPITNLILGSYYPLFITFILFIGMIILFGKRGNEV